MKLSAHRSARRSAHRSAYRAISQPSFRRGVFGGIWPLPVSVGEPCLFLIVTMALSMIGCVTSPTGRQQLILLPDTQMNSMGAQAFGQIKSKTPKTSNVATKQYVLCVTQALQLQVPKEFQGNWDVEVFEDQQANAFALPGGHIGVYTGILRAARNSHQLAAVLGHEIGHVLARHGNERVSQNLVTELGLSVVNEISKNTKQGQLLMAALGLGAQVGVTLPFGRKQELEADRMGLMLMAKAGFDPRQSIELWKNMKALSGGSPPEFLSTHPSPENRIIELEGLIPEALQISHQARSIGMSPRCDSGRPS